MKRQFEKFCFTSTYSTFWAKYFFALIKKIFLQSLVEIIYVINFLSEFCDPPTPLQSFRNIIFLIKKIRQNPKITFSCSFSTIFLLRILQGYLK